MRRLRVAKDISQERLANEADVERAYVRRLERKMENPGILDKIATALGAHVSKLLIEPMDGDEPQPLKAGRRPNG
jgi:transcriptional regulator with XRE-family HTH domain